MIYMKNNNENKKIDVSKVSGEGLLSIKEKDGKFNVISSRVLDSFPTREKAQEAINNIAEENWYSSSLYSAKKASLKYLKSKRDH